MLNSFTTKLKVYYHRKWSFDVIKQNRLSSLLLFFYLFLKELRWLFLSLIDNKSISLEYIKNDTQKPSLLLFQEDDISFDRSYRTQPHWFFQEYGKLPFQTFILEANFIKRLPVDKELLREQGISLIPQRERHLYSRRIAVSSPVCQRIRKDILNSTLIGLFGSSSEASIMFRIVMLLNAAKVLCGFCEGVKIKAFLICENYFLDSDAMLLIAPFLNIKTISFQYSNRLSNAVPQMLTTSDMMLTFSPLYHSRLQTDTIKPGKFVDIGYIYDTSFKYVRDRAILRKQSYGRQELNLLSATMMNQYSQTNMGL